MLESRANNASLMALKDCVRAKALLSSPLSSSSPASKQAFVHIPWRANKLTLLLKPLFDPENIQPSRTLIVAHASPHIQDAGHSVSTLGYAEPFRVPARILARKEAEGSTEGEHDTI